MTLSVFDMDTIHNEAKVVQQSFGNVWVPVLTILLFLFTVKEIGTKQSDMISSQADAPTITSSSDPLILKLWNGQAPLETEYEDADTKITVYLAQGDTTARMMRPPKHLHPRCRRR
jgi:hypothetical protein